MKATLISCCVAAALVLQSAFGITAYASEYFPGKVVFAFKAEYMPNQADVNLQNLSSGIQPLDDIIAAHQGTRLTKLKAGYFSEYSSEAAAILGRTFVLEYEDGTDPAVFVAELSALPYFRFVEVNPKLQVVYFGTQRYEPSDNYFQNGHQWNLDSIVDDREDIDAPEAWAIERGDTSLIIGITDTGTMIDTFQTPWELHPDFERYFNAAEDFPPTMALTFDDVDQNDDTPSADPDTTADNVIGSSWATAPTQPTDPLDMAFWRSQPINAAIVPERDNPWKFSHYNTHGLNVESIAAARAGDPPGVPGTVGVANQCMVYHVRNHGPDPLKQIEVLEHAALYAKVINMSWGYYPINPGSPFRLTTRVIAKDDNVVLVAAVGNISDGATEVAWPARYDWVLGVGNMSRQLDRYYDSTYGPQIGFVSVVAPVDNGVPVNSHGDVSCGGSQMPCDQHPEVILFNGTSAASPTAAGIAALLRSRFPSLTQEEIRDRIERSAEKYWPDTQQNRLELGEGKVNAYRALTEWGTITDSTTWDPSYTRDRMYYISGDLTIETGATLTINPGTVIKVAPDHERSGIDADLVEINVEGSLIINGTADDPVVFESFTDTLPTNHDWFGITFDSLSSGTLKNVVIKNAKIGIDSYVALSVDSCTISDAIEGIEANANITVTNSTLSNISGFAIEVLGDTAWVSNVEISNCGTGIQLTGTNSTLFCEGSYIHDIEYGGVNGWKSTQSITVRGTRIDDATDGVQTFFYCPTVIDSCEFNGNDTAIFAAANNQLSVTRCKIDNSVTNGIFCQSSSNITINANTISNSPVGIYCWNSSPVVENHTWIHDTLVGIKADGNADPLVRDTRISDNSDGVGALNGAEPDLGGAGADTCGSGPNEGKNSIHNNSGYHVVNLSPSVTVSAECNYWGARGPLPGKFSGAVDYTPHLGTDDPNPTSPGDVGGDGKRPGDQEKPLPATYALSCNYPNPFNPATTLRYDVPAPGGRVSIRIYNVKGQLVKTLADGEKPPGFYQVGWHGRSDRGMPVASGVYFVRMDAPRYTQTRKIILLK